MGNGKKQKAKDKAHKLTLSLTNQELLDLRDGLRGLLRYEIDRDVAWKANRALQLIAGPVRAIEDTQNQTLERYARKGEDGKAQRQGNDQGQVSFLIPVEDQPALQDEIDQFLGSKEAEGYTFPADWRIPFEALPKKMMGRWLAGLAPLVLSDEEEAEGEDEPQSP